MDRRAIAVTGIVQGVGFRPFVHDLANRLGLIGFVRNQSGSVLIEVEGEPDSLDRFVGELTASPPPLARIDDVQWSRRAPEATVISGSKTAGTKAVSQSSCRPMSPRVMNACESCSIRGTAGTIIRFLTAPSVAHG